MAQERERRQHILGDGAGRNAADQLQRRSPDHAVGAATESGVPGVAAGQHAIEEEALLIGEQARRAEIELHRIRIEEALGRLHDADARVGEEAERAIEKIPVRHEVGIEDRDELTVGQLKGMVDVAGFGVAVVGAPEIAHALAGAELLQPIAPAVVQHPDARIGIVDALGADDRALEDLQILVVGGNKHVDRRQLARRRAAQARGVIIRLVAAIGPARHHQKAEEIVEDKQQLGDETRPDPQLPGPAEALHLEGCIEPPGKIAQEKGGAAQRHEAARPGAIMRQRWRYGEKHADHEGQRGRSRARPHRMRLSPPAPPRGRSPR